MQASLSSPLQRLLYGLASFLILFILKQQQQNNPLTLTQSFSPGCFCVSLMNRKHINRKGQKIQGVSLSSSLPSRFRVLLPLLTAKVKIRKSGTPDVGECVPVLLSADMMGSEPQRDAEQVLLCLKDCYV